MRGDAVVTLYRVAPGMWRLTLGERWPGLPGGEWGVTVDVVGPAADRLEEVSEACGGVECFAERVSELWRLPGGGGDR